ncbi:protein kinase [Candidatus Woesearchaeota archaeon]|nr:protein kinase [Candidatus Woesearchaeota archaeon]
MSDPITQISVNKIFYQLTDILYYTRNTAVYVGHPLQNPKHKYAIKKPIPSGRVNRVIKEANTLRQIIHPNIIKYIDHSEDFIEPYLVMELAVGTLDSLIRREKVSKKVILRYIEDIPSFLSLFHRLGIAHTNVSLGNIGYDHHGNIKILDLSDAVPCQFPSNQKLKMNCASILSPEYLLNREINPMTDTYCAARIFECLLFGDYIISEKPIKTIQEHYKHLPHSFFSLYAGMTKDNPIDRLEGNALRGLVKEVIKDLKNIEIFTSDLLTDII